MTLPASEIETLLASSVLKGLIKEEVMALVADSEIQTPKKGDLILNEADIGQGLYIILKGEVDVFLPKHNKKGVERLTEVHITKLKTGDCFGEYSLIDADRTSASVKALLDLKVCYIERKKFNQFSDRNHRAAKIIYRNMLEFLVERLRGSIKELDMAIVIR